MGVWFGAGMFVFLVLLMLYPNNTLTGFTDLRRPQDTKFEEKPSYVEMDF